MVSWLQLLLSKSPPHHACLEWSWLRTTLLSSLPTHQPHLSIWQTLLENQLRRQRKATLVLMTRSLCLSQLSLEDLKIWLYTFTDESYLVFGCIDSFLLIDVVWCETTYVMPQSWFMMLCLATSTSVDVLTFTLSAETGESGECSLVTDNCSIHSAQLTEYCHVSSLTPAHTLLHPHHQLERSSNSVRVSVVYSVQSASPFFICSVVCTHKLRTVHHILTPVDTSNDMTCSSLHFK